MRILKFSSERCAPCKTLSDNLEKENLEGIEIVSLNSLDHIEEFHKYGVRTVPTLIEVDENGEVKERWSKDGFLDFLRNR